MQREIKGTNHSIQRVEKSFLLSILYIYCLFYCVYNKDKKYMTKTYFYTYNATLRRQFNMLNKVITSKKTRSKKLQVHCKRS